MLVLAALLAFGSADAFVNVPRTGISIVTPDGWRVRARYGDAPTNGVLDFVDVNARGDRIVGQLQAHAEACPAQLDTAAGHERAEAMTRRHKHEGWRTVDVAMARVGKVAVPRITGRTSGIFGDAQHVAYMVPDGMSCAFVFWTFPSQREDVDAVVASTMARTLGTRALPPPPSLVGPEEGDDTFWWGSSALTVLFGVLIALRNRRKNRQFAERVRVATIRAANRGGSLAPLGDDELAALVGRLDRDAERTLAWMHSPAVWVGGGVVACGAWMATLGILEIAALVAGAGVGLIGYGLYRADRAAQRRVRSLLEVVAQWPVLVECVRHTSETHRIAVETSEGRLSIVAREDPQTLLALLERHCPNARVEGVLGAIEHAA